MHTSENNSVAICLRLSQIIHRLTGLSLLKQFNSFDDITSLNSDLHSIGNWADQWRVTFNAKKTEYMLIGKKGNKSVLQPLFLNGVQITRVNSHCHLGLWLTENMSWEKHTQEIIKRTSNSVTLLKRMSSKISLKTKLAIDKTYVRPKLEYATCVFSGNMTDDQSE